MHLASSMIIFYVKNTGEIFNSFNNQLIKIIFQILIIDRSFTMLFWIVLYLFPGVVFFPTSNINWPFAVIRHDGLPLLAHRASRARWQSQCFSLPNYKHDIPLDSDRIKLYAQSHLKIHLQSVITFKPHSQNNSFAVVTITFQ